MPTRLTLTADTTQWRRLAAGPGFFLDVPYEGRWRQRPSLHVEGDGHWELRLRSGGQHLLWIRIHPRWYYCGFLRGPAESPFPWRLPPIRAEEARDIPHEPRTPEWWATWVRRMARQLEKADASVLHAGRWYLLPLNVVATAEADCAGLLSVGLYSPPERPHGLENALRFEPFWVETWGGDEPCPSRPFTPRGGVLSSRAPSRQDDGRVKAWRKHAVDGTLPPVLLLYVRLADKWLVLDGHDRLHAALLEGRMPPLLGLWFTPHRETHDPGPHAITRAWPLPDGSEWMTSVRRWCPRAPPGASAENWKWFVGPQTFDYL